MSEKKFGENVSDLMDRLKSNGQSIPPTQPMRSDRCGLCRHSVFENDQQESGSCHYLPPSVVTFPQQDMLSGQIRMAVQSFFTPVTRLNWCSKFALAIETLGDKVHE